MYHPPYHRNNRAWADVLDELWEERLGRKILVVLLCVCLFDRHHLHRHELVSLSFEAPDDFSNQTSLDAVRLDHDVCLLHEWLPRETEEWIAGDRVAKGRATICVTENYKLLVQRFELVLPLAQSINQSNTLIRRTQVAFRSQRINAIARKDITGGRALSNSHFYTFRSIHRPMRLSSAQRVSSF